MWKTVLLLILHQQSCDALNNMARFTQRDSYPVHTFVMHIAVLPSYFNECFSWTYVEAKLCRVTQLTYVAM